MRTYGKFIVLAFIMSLAMLRPAMAQEAAGGKIYEWQDSQGTLNITDSLEKVPKQYRSSVKVREVASPPREDQTSPEQAPGTEQQPRNSAAPAADNEEQLKRMWQQRMREARDNVERLTEQLQSQEVQLRVLKDRGGEGLYYTTEIAAQVKQLEDQIADTKNALEQSKKAVEEDIPDAARKAGIPPGWLRE